MDEINNSLRLDKYILSKYFLSSRMVADKLIENGKVSVNGSIVFKKSYLVKTNDEVLAETDFLNIKQDSIDIPIIYKNDEIIVINKPAGLLTHSKGEFNSEATVASWLKPYLKEDINDRSGIVHRLDRGTSGIMICALNLKTQKYLQSQFANRKVKKVYLAVVKGELNPKQAIIDMPIERNPKKPQTFRVGAQGKSALTEYSSVKSNQKYTLVKLMPATGRTHQLRVHLSKINFPIVGDNLYGGEPSNRLYLHALSLGINIPGCPKHYFTTKIPMEFNKLINDY